jgi:hypothetical protein
MQTQTPGLVEEAGVWAPGSEEGGLRPGLLN